MRSTGACSPTTRPMTPRLDAQLTGLGNRYPGGLPRERRHTSLTIRLTPDSFFRRHFEVARCATRCTPVDSYRDVDRSHLRRRVARLLHRPRKLFVLVSDHAHGLGQVHAELACGRHFSCMCAHFTQVCLDLNVHIKGRVHPSVRKQPDIVEQKSVPHDISALGCATLVTNSKLVCFAGEPVRLARRGICPTTRSPPQTLKRQERQKPLSTSLDLQDP
jgi:hypothetical protein